MHDCVDWTTRPPTRKTPLLVLTWGDDHIYTVVPNELKTLEDVAKKEFDLGDVDVSFFSPCVNLCHGQPARITEHAWEHISPFIGCATVEVNHVALGAGPSAKRKAPSPDAPMDEAASDQGEQVRTPSRSRRRLASEDAPMEPPSPPPYFASPRKEVEKDQQSDHDHPLESPLTEPLRRSSIPIKQEKGEGGSGTQPSSDSQYDIQTQTQTESGESQKLMIRVAHRPSNQESKFTAKGTTRVAKVLAGACKSFGLDANQATLYLIVSVQDEDGEVENLFPCDKNDTIARAGAERDTESRFLLKVTGEA